MQIHSYLIIANYLILDYYKIIYLVLQKDPVLSLCFHNLTKRMQPNKAIIRIERKLLNRIYYVLKNERTYECGIIK